MLTIFIDGACEPFNPGGHGACAMVAYPGIVSARESDVPRLPAPIHASARLIGSGDGMTNNIAEWRGLRGTLVWLSERAERDDEIRVFMDSQLVVNQFNSTWKCNSPELLLLRDECWKLRKLIPRLTLTWVRRDENWVADKMINDLYATNKIHVTVRPKRQ